MLYSVEQPPHCDLLRLSPRLDDLFPLSKSEAKTEFYTWSFPPEGKAALDSLLMALAVLKGIDDDGLCRPSMKDSMMMA